MIIVVTTTIIMIDDQLHDATTTTCTLIVATYYYYYQQKQTASPSVLRPSQPRYQAREDDTESGRLLLLQEACNHEHLLSLFVVLLCWLSQKMRPRHTALAVAKLPGQSYHQSQYIDC